MKANVSDQARKLVQRESVLLQSWAAGIRTTTLREELTYIRATLLKQKRTPNLQTKRKEQ